MLLGYLVAFAADNLIALAFRGVRRRWVDEVAGFDRASFLTTPTRIED
jgi:hypothetical protein